PISTHSDSLGEETGELSGLAAYDPGLHYLSGVETVFGIGPKYEVVYRSRSKWDNDQNAEEHHRVRAMKATNVGGSRTPGWSVWYTSPRTDILPTLTSTLIVSFVLSSIYRYRASLAARLNESKHDVIADVFVREADSIMIPAMRNLLYRNEMHATMIGA
ncbi:MAG: hypothetical protein HOP29_01155, partial [Phycisphaerales bacterium]|nr:hypothetical protein [Phycisphaerales bacterium]